MFREIGSGVADLYELWQRSVSMWAMYLAGDCVHRFRCRRRVVLRDPWLRSWSMSWIAGTSPGAAAQRRSTALYCLLETAGAVASNESYHHLHRPHTQPRHTVLASTCL